MKRKLKMIIAVVLCFCMSFSPVYGADYGDTKGHWAEKSIDRWSEEEIVHGSGGYFMPDKNMTRAEAAATFSNLKKLSVKADLSKYKDVGLGEWYDGVIALCVADGIMSGVAEDRIDPMSPITREQFFTMYANAMGIEPEETLEKTMDDSEKVSPWAKGFVNALINRGYVSGLTSTTIAPDVNINRASVMALFDKSIVSYVTEGGTVKVDNDGIVLVVTSDPIVIESEKDITVVVVEDKAEISLKSATGEVTVNVDGEDVAVTDAPAGTVVNTDENTKVNGETISDDTEFVVEAAEEETTSSGGSGGSGGGDTPTPTPTIPDSDIDAIITSGCTAVNNEMILGGDYAKLTAETTSNVVTVSISDGNKTVTDVYNDIISVILTKLNENYQKVASLWTKTSTNKITLSATPIDGAVVHDFVQASALKGAGGASISGGDTIDCLYGQSIDLHIIDIYGEDHIYTVDFAIDEAVIDAIITAGCTAVNNEMTLGGDYAKLTANTTDNVVTVAISKGTKTVTDVYNDIIAVLVTKLNENYKTVEKLWTNTSANKLTLSATPIDSTAIHDFVQASSLTGAGGAAISGGDTIDCLYGQEIDINIVDRGFAEIGYTFKFVVDKAAIDAILTAGCTAVNNEMVLGGNYAALSFDASEKTISVNITDGSKTVTDVYNDIISVILTKLNENYKTVATLWTNTVSNSITLSSTPIDGTAVHDFVQASSLHGPEGLDDTITGADTINNLNGQSFALHIVDQAGADIEYNVSFTSGPI